MKCKKILFAAVGLVVAGLVFTWMTYVVIAVLLLSASAGLASYALSNRNKTIVTATVFFLLVTTQYYWDGLLSILAWPALGFLLCLYVALAIYFIWEILKVVKERGTNEKRLGTIVYVGIVLTLTTLKPFGIINFDQLEGRNLLVASMEGTASCNVTIKLKEGGHYIKRGVCFGVESTRGTYRLINDTIHFNNTSGGGKYLFALIKPVSYPVDMPAPKYVLVAYSNLNDTTGRSFEILENNLVKK